MTTAQQAIYAAKHRNIWGRYATRQYVKNKHIPCGLYRIACQLEAVYKAERLPILLINQAV